MVYVKRLRRKAEAITRRETAVDVVVRTCLKARFELFTFLTAPGCSLLMSLERARSGVLHEGARNGAV